MSITAFNWIRREQNTLRGFIDFELRPSGLILHSCTLHQSGDRRWIGFPARPQIGTDGRPLTTPKTGKIAYSTIIEIKDHEARAVFEREALAAVDRLFGKGGEQ